VDLLFRILDAGSDKQLLFLSWVCAFYGNSPYAVIWVDETTNTFPFATREVLNFMANHNVLSFDHDALPTRPDWISS